jgi:SAM-dependent methyltransferase
MKSKIENHYEADYFENYQRKFGEFGGRANVFMYKKYILESDTVLDFGCGGGFLLKNLKCKNKIGVELNPVARNFCINTNKIDCFEDIDQIPNESIDVIISNHCLEHTLSPYNFISKMYDKLKDGGKIIIVVPLESYNYKWKPNDVNNHLYSFSPMNLGNLLQGSNFKEIKCDVIYHKWVPFYFQINKIFGDTVFNILSFIYGMLNRRCVQVRGIGVK